MVNLRTSDCNVKKGYEFCQSRALIRRLGTIILAWRPFFYLRLVHVGFVTEKVVMEKIFLRVFWFPLSVIIPPVLHNIFHSTITDEICMILANVNVLE